MNEYKYDEIEVGTEEYFALTVNNDMMDKFREISGDTNPLHCDKKFAKKQKFPDRVVYGMLVASFYSTLVGVYLPGKYCLLQCVNSDFISPVFIGDVLTICGKVVEKNDSVKRIVIKAWIRNQNGQKVSKAKIEAGVLDTNG